jgi:hypothetical protein
MVALHTHIACRTCSSLEILICYLTHSCAVEDFDDNPPHDVEMQIATGTATMIKARQKFKLGETIIYNSFI